MAERTEQQPAPAPALDPTSPEFKQAVAVAVAAAVEAMRANVMTEVVGALAAAKVNDTPADPSKLISELTVAIAGMTDVGNNRKVIAPDEAKRRIDAHGRMIEVLERIHADASLKPLYEVVGEMQLEEQLIQKFTAAGDGKWVQTTIIWRGIPSSAMRPLNDIAKEIYGHYLHSIGGTTANTAGYREQPTWVSYGGLQIVGAPPQSAVNRGLVAPPAEPMEIGANLQRQGSELTSVDNPNATLVPILGKAFPPAVRTANGESGTLQFPK